MGQIVFVIKDISPRKILVPMLIMMEMPIVNRNSSGSIHDDVDSINIRIMIGNKIASAFKTVEAAVSWIKTRAGASPANALSLPIRFNISLQASFSIPLAMVAEKKALPSL